MTRRVYLTGGALHCAAGEDLDRVANACMSAPPLPPRRTLDTQLGVINLPYFEFAEAQPVMTRLVALVQNVLDRAALPAAARTRIGVFVGTSSGLIQEYERAYAEEIARGDGALALRHPYTGEIAEQLAARIGSVGPRHTFTTACSAGANALLYASWMIRERQIDHALVIGAEFGNRISLLGFHGLALIAPERCRPFDLQRAGVVLGEGAAVALLGHERGDATWEMLGGGTLCDTSHPTSPAAGMIAQTLRQALADARLAPADIRAIKAHGTGTPANDLAEGQGICEMFGARPPPVTSIKPVFGHTLGACGVVETLAFTRCLERGWMPATPACIEPDPEIPLTPLRENQRTDAGAVLCNYFGFGGNNCCLVLAPC